MDNRIKDLLGTGKCVIELGCGSGEILDSLSAEFSEHIGLDVSTRRLQQSSSTYSEKWRFEVADLNMRFPIKDSTADAIIANQVIEHIIDPGYFAREIHRVLRVGGRCVVTTPNIRYLKQIAHLLLSGYGPRTAGGNTMDGTWDDGHLHYFTHRDLRELFLSVGFHQVETRALIDLGGGGRLRRWMDRYAVAWPIREFLSGCILLLAKK